MGFLFICIALLIIYKILDRLVRIPKIDKPSGRKKNLLVTGCDTGFGNIFSKRMAAKGFTVFSGCLTEQGKLDLNQQYPGLIKPFIMNVSEERSVLEGYRYVSSQLPPNEGLWAIINNAGIVGTAGPLEWQTKQNFQTVFNVNVFGILNVTKAFLPLVKRTQGRIVNTCSIVGRFVLSFAGPYTTSKYAAEALSDTMRREFYPFGISVHIIEPGFFATRLTDPEHNNPATMACWDKLCPSMKQEYGDDFLKGFLKMATELTPMLSNKNLNLVVDCYEHAVTAMFPRGRYMPGFDSSYIYWFLTLLPEWIPDTLLKLFGDRHLPRPAGVKKYKIK